MDTEQKRRAAKEMVELAERTLAESIMRRDQARQKYQTTIAPLLAAVACSVIAGWLAHIFQKIFSWPAFPTIPIAGVIAGVAAYFWQMRAAKQKIIESSLITRTISYPGFKKKYDRMTLKNFIVCFVVFLTVILGPIIGQRCYPAVFTQERFDKYFLIGFAFMFAVFFYTLFRAARGLYSARCPTCKTKLVVRGRRPESRDSYSGFCRQCKVLWDLDISNRSD